MQDRMRYYVDLPGNFVTSLRVRDLARLVGAANLYVCTSLIRFDGGVANCKSLIEVTQLAQHSVARLTLETIGPNAKECIEVLRRFIESMT